jgi:hypothetical protein
MSVLLNRGAHATAPARLDLRQQPHCSGRLLAKLIVRFRREFWSNPGPLRNERTVLVERKRWTQPAG